MVLTILENQHGPLEAPYMSSMSHTSGIDIIGGSFALEFEESPLGDNVGGVGGWNHTPCLVNLLANLSLILIHVHDKTVTLIQVSLKTLNL